MLDELPSVEPGEARRLDARIGAQLKSIADPFRSRRGQAGLFSGADGESKTLAARVLGERLGRNVYRVDLSSMVSKYIGETEKNLARIFAAANEMPETVLLFDEADALFGKRGEVEHAHDRYANQATNHLLRFLEDFDGLVILATNLRDNLDEALQRRFDWTVDFPVPEPHRRISLWQNLRRRVRVFFSPD